MNLPPSSEQNESPLASSSDPQNFGGFFTDFSFIQSQSGDAVAADDDEGEATVESVDDNLAVADDDTFTVTEDEVIGENNGEVNGDNVGSNFFGNADAQPSNLDDGQDDFLQSINVGQFPFPSFDAEGQQEDDFGFGDMNNNFFNAFGDMSVNQETSNADPEHDSSSSIDTQPVLSGQNQENVGLNNFDNNFFNGFGNVEAEESQETANSDQQQDSSPSTENSSLTTSEVEDTASSPNQQSATQQPSWDNSMNAVHNMPTQTWNQNNPGFYANQYQYPNQQMYGSQQPSPSPNHYIYYQPNNHYSTHNYIVSPSQSYYAYNQGSGSQSWSDYYSSSPSLSYSADDYYPFYNSQDSTSYWADNSQNPHNINSNNQYSSWSDPSQGSYPSSNWLNYDQGYSWSGNYYDDSSNQGGNWGYTNYPSWDDYGWGSASHDYPGLFARMGSGSSSRNPHGGPSRSSSDQNSISKFVGEQCFSTEGNHGQCLTEMECSLSEGKASGSGSCFETESRMSKVCCVNSAKCKGLVHNQKGINIQSPGYPETINNLAPCPVTVMIQPKVCQVRIDFLDFSMGQMKAGVCDYLNSMLIQSSQSTAILPITRFCGNITSGEVDALRTDVPHMYVHFPHTLGVDKRMIPNKDDFLRSLTFTFNVKEQTSKWNIRLTQIECDGSALQAPDGCAQYYYESNGNIKSLNLPDSQYSTKTYMDVCIEKSPKDCGVQYRFEKLGLGPTRSGGQGLGYGLVCNDLIVFRGEKTSICGNGNGAEITLPAKGPVGFTFKSDSQNSELEHGYSIDYSLLQDCSQPFQNPFSSYKKK